MKRLLAALLVTALTGCTSTTTSQGVISDAPTDGSHRQFTDGTQTIRVVRVDGDVWRVDVCKGADGLAQEPLPGALERISLQLDVGVRGGAEDVEHPLRRAVREATATGASTDIVALVDSIMGEEALDPAVRLRLISALATGAALDGDGQLALARAAFDLDEGPGHLLAILAARPDSNESTLAAAVMAAVRAGPGSCRAILHRCVERGLSKAVRGCFLRAACTLPSDEDREPFLEAFARAPLDPAEQLALVEHAMALRSSGARRVLLRLLENRDVTDEAVAECSSRALRLVETEDATAVLVGAIATGRRVGISGAIHAALEHGEPSTQRAVADAALRVDALDDASQLELVAIVAAIIGDPQRSVYGPRNEAVWRLEKLAERPWLTEGAKAAILAAAPPPALDFVRARLSK